MNRALSILIFLLGTVVLNAQYDPNYELRLNCGTSVSTTYNGNIFDPDQYFDGGGTYTLNPGGLVQPYTTEWYDDDKELNYNIPSAEEVEANGVGLGKMNKLLLAKIEEMMLYILEQEERLKKLENTKQPK